VLIDSKAGGGSGNMFYLPLDKLLDKANSRDLSEQAPDSSNATPAQKEPDSVTVEARGRGDR
jgi:hypothetical protein